MCLQGGIAEDLDSCAGSDPESVAPNSRPLELSVHGGDTCATRILRMYSASSVSPSLFLHCFHIVLKDPYLPSGARLSVLELPRKPAQSMSDFFKASVLELEIGTQPTDLLIHFCFGPNCTDSGGSDWDQAQVGRAGV